jgi:ubiquinone biosynthesis monooxygenase Coq7
MSLIIRTIGRRSLSAARLYSSSSVNQGLASSVYVDQRLPFSPATHETPIDLTRPEREALEAALQVDQAGEVAANYIYMGQLAVLGRDPRVGPLIQVRTSLYLDTDRHELRVE